MIISESSRKRRVVFYFSDEDEDAINLASPGFPNKQSSQDHRQNDKNSLEKATLNFVMEIENKLKVKAEEKTDQEANQPLREDFSVISNCKSTGKSSIEKYQSCATAICVNKDSLNYAAPPGSPKRRKVMRTRIDERGREVTEVVWEGEETEAKKADNFTTKKADNSASTKSANNSAPATKKSPAIAKYHFQSYWQRRKQESRKVKGSQTGQYSFILQENLRSSKRITMLQRQSFQHDHSSLW